MATSRRNLRITIVGGGYSGAAAAVQLARAAPAPLAITVVEPRERVGPGLAYSAPDPDHRLNGALDNHLLDPGEPESLRLWCERRRILAGDPEALAPNGRVYLRRADFGAYLAEATPAAVEGAGSSFRHARTTAVAIRAGGSGFDVLTQDGDVLAGDMVVIATGNGGVRLPASLAPLASHPALVPDPMDLGRVRAIPRGARVLVVGTGLTALDVISTLVRAGHRGPITAISRHGLRPRSQRPPSAEGGGGMARLLARIEGEVPAFVRAAGAAPTARGLLRALRNRIREAQGDGESWYAPFDDLRDVVWQVWPTMASAQKRRFLRWLRPWYDVHRFRSPPQNEAIVREAEARGQVAFTTVSRHRREGGDPAAFDAIVNCAGLDSSFGARDNPFLADLLAQGLARADDCGLGFAVDAQCRPVGAGGAAHPRLRMVGPPTAGAFGDPLGALFIAPQIRRMLPGVFADLAP